DEDAQLHRLRARQAPRLAASCAPRLPVSGAGLVVLCIRPRSMARGPQGAVQQAKLSDRRRHAALQ
ncbi:hypothetical protein, partial [Azohydromonas lata]